MRPTYLLPFALFLPATAAQAAPPPLFSPNIPFYLQALDRSGDPQAQALRARIASGPAALARERALAEKEGIITRAGQPQQALPPPDQNAAPLYTELDALRKQKPFYLTDPAESFSLRYTYTPAQLDAIQSIIRSRPDILTLLHQALAKPQCVFPTDSQPFDFPKEYTGLREDARELKAESALLAFGGKYAEAVANQELGFRFSSQATSTPKQIGLLVGEAIDAITVGSLQDILAKAGPNADLDNQVSDDVLALPPLSLSHALSGEPAEADAEFDILRRAKPAELAEALQLTGLQTVSPAAKFTPAEQRQINNLLDAAEADYLHGMRQIIPAADNPAARRAVFAAEARPDTDDPIRTISDTLNPVVSAERIMGSSPTLGGLEQQAARVAARRLVLAAGAAVLAAKAQTGAFPAALPAPFTDPFTGKPLGYRREGTGFVVYSAGPTGTFDGGKPGDPAFGPNTVFRYPLVPIPVPPEALR